MSDPRPPARNGPAWQATHPSPSPVPIEPKASPRAQPPLTEAIQGLDTRELEGQTVFDQLFGDKPKR